MAESQDHHGHGHSSTDNLKTAFLLNSAFTVIELVGGLLTNSVAILTDSLHDFGDSASLGLSWYFDRLARKGRTPRHTYGFRRYRLLGGLITGLVLMAGLGVVLWHAVGRLRDPEPVNAPGMIALAVLGITFNGAAVWRMKKGSSLTEKIASWHLLEDTLGWAAVLAGALVMMVWNAPIIDPLLSIGISLFVLWNVGRNMKRVMSVFLQTTPESFDVDAFRREVDSLPMVLSTHHIHGWSLDGESHVLSIHLVMDAFTSRADLVKAKESVRAMLRDQPFEHVTIDVELDGEDCAAAAEDTV